MRRKELDNGYSMPVLGLGTWGTGGRIERDPDWNEKESIDVMRKCFDAGFMSVDCAEYYAAGYSEEIVGKAMEGYDRSQFFLTSKVWKTNLRKEDVLRSAEGSLRRLGTDCLDLYLIHHVNEDIPLEETLEGMCRLVETGKTRYIGVSNFGVRRLARAQALSPYPIVVNQVHYNLAVRESEVCGLLSYCQEHDVLLEAWRPLRGLEACPLTDELCARYSCTFGQLALAFLLNQRNVVTITAMRSARHVPENLGALELNLSQEDMERLRTEYPGQRYVSESVPLKD